ncbi:hypothetical protein LIER_05723 [Lithospermum erythrorhizon]|uniref:Secreted protein n=1 Tax=Lithospermum erythrorhizon TaxID=34254 RepID=A0AAV3P1I5_LITER
MVVLTFLPSLLLSFVFVSEDKRPDGDVEDPVMPEAEEGRKLLLASSSVLISFASAEPGGRFSIATCKKETSMVTIISGAI